MKIISQGKILILGGTSGIGFYVAKKFRGDHEVIVVGRDENKGALAAVMGNVSYIQCDISKKAERNKLIKKLEKESITKIIHCAGIFSHEKTPAYKEAYKEVKLGGLAIVKELMASHDITHVVAISSLYTFLPDNETYQFEKDTHIELEHAVLNIDNNNTIINCVAPGLVDTSLAREGFGDSFEKILKSAPGSRVLQPEEVAEMAYWLANQTTIQKSVIPIDGGYLRYFKK